MIFQCDVPDGGLVPKSLYKEEYSDKLPEGPPLSIDSLYQTSYVVKDYPHEVSGSPIDQISPFFLWREETTLNVEFVLDKLWCQRLSTFKQIFCSDNSLAAITQYCVYQASYVKDYPNEYFSGHSLTGFHIVLTVYISNVIYNNN